MTTFALKDIKIALKRHESGFDVDAFWRDCRAGYAWCNLEGERLRLSDIKVMNEFRLPWPAFFGMLNWAGSCRCKINLRGRGIGTAMMQRVLAEAETMGVREIWGSVVPRDLASNPKLLDWYKRLGFEVVERTDECVRDATAMVIKRFSVN